MASLPDQLRHRLARPLPGRPAQRTFAHELSYGRHFGPPPAAARQAAVLALVFRRGSKWHTVLTRRQQRLSAHSGQISLPGGSIEAGESAPAAAARECQEELGLEARHIHVLGPLTPLYVFGSGFLVRPFVGTCPVQPTWVPAEEEVAEILEVPLVNLIRPQCVVSCARPLGRTAFSAPAIGWGENRVWGATAMILGELITILRECVWE